MRKLFLALTVLYFSLGNLLIAQTVPDNTYNHRLYYTGKVWGFLKYFHSEVAKGSKNWDNVLFQTLADVRNDITETDFNVTLGNMINKAGLMSAPNTQLPIVSDSLKFNLDFKWLNDPVFSAAIKARLDTVKDWFRPQDNYYIKNSPDELGPIYIYDSTFFKQKGELYLNEDYRLLALFRYWNVINYFYPYKNLMDQNWDSTLIEFIPKLVKAFDNKSVYLSFMEMVTRINDSHSFAGSSIYYDMFGGSNYLPLTLKYVENQTVITGVFTNNTDIKVGDIIKSINGVDINTVRDSLRKYSNGSNNGAINHNINSFLIIGLHQSDRMTIANDSGQREVTIQRNVTDADYYNLITNNAPGLENNIFGLKKIWIY